MIVVDLGCCEHYGEISVEPLLDRFHPDILYGFDPALEAPLQYQVGETQVELSSVAAWLFDGEVGYIFDGLRSRIGDFDPRVRCFDFPVWLRGLGAQNVVCKMDIEMAEIPLLEAMHEGGEDELLSLLLVEWHDHLPEWNDDLSARRDRLVGVLRCAVEAWA